MSNYAREAIDWQIDGPVSEGPNRSFADSFLQAYEEQVTGWGVLSVERGLEEAESEYLDDVFQQTGKRIEPLFSSGITGNPFVNESAIGAARYYEGRGELPKALRARNAEIEELRKQFPDIPAYESIWGATKQRAQAAEQRGVSFQRRGRNFGSRAGGFLGAVIGSVDPRTDPVNTLTLGLGGAGKTFASKVGQETAFAGLVEAVNQFTGVQENRSLLGLTYGTEQALAQIALTAAGAGIIRGGAEGVSAAGQKLLRSKELDISPADIPEGQRLTPEQRAQVIDTESRAQIREQSIYGDTPSAQRMFADEMEAHFNALQEWLPSPSTKADLLASTAIPEIPTANVIRAAPDFALGSTRNAEELDYIIRQADPQLGREFDRVNADIEEAEIRIAELEQTRPSKEAVTPKSQELTDIDARIEELERKLAAAERPQVQGRYRNQIKAAQAAREELAERAFLEDPKVTTVNRDIAAEKQKIDKATDRLNALNVRRDRLFQKPVRRLPTAQDFVAGMTGRQLSPESTRRFDNVEEIDALFTSVEKETVARFEAARRQLDETGELDIAGVKVSKDATILTEDGEMTVDAIFRDLSEDDELMKAAVACKVSL